MEALFHKHSAARQVPVRFWSYEAFGYLKNAREPIGPWPTDL